MHFLFEIFPKKARMRFEASRFGGFHWYKTKQNKTNKLACFIDTLVTKKGGTPRMLPSALSDPPLGPSYVLSEAQSVCYFPDLLQLEGCYAGPHNATCDHTDGEYEPHASQHNKQLGP